MIQDAQYNYVQKLPLIWGVGVGNAMIFIYRLIIHKLFKWINMSWTVIEYVIARHEKLC